VTRYLLSPEAQEDLRHIRAHYLEVGDAGVARYVLGEIAKAFRLLATHPGVGHVRPDLTGEPVKFWAVFSYLIVYDPVTQPVGIVRVVHGSRDLETLFREKPPRQ
jgi:plasmid stabilization system protein ParE